MIYFGIRIFYHFSIFTAIIGVAFVLFHTVPSDPARTILGPNADSEQVQTLSKELGLDKPVIDQFMHYLGGLVCLDMGRSYVDQRKVFQEVHKKLLITLPLIGMSLLFTCCYLLLSLLGFRFNLLYKLTNIVDFSIASVPVFFSGVIVAIGVLSLFQVVPFSGKLQTYHDWLYLISPALVLAFYPMAILSGILKKELDEILQSSFILSARMWGFGAGTIIFRYSFKNTLIPLLAIFSNVLPMLFTGAFIVEIIFSLPGISSLLIQSILQQDFPMLEGIVITNAMVFIITNLCFEFAYPLVDKRIIHEVEE